MGLTYRKRTRGKDSWINYGFSSKGFRASYSMKFGDTTINIGNGRRRIRHNLGNGFIWQTSRTLDPKRKKKAKVATYRDTRPLSEVWSECWTEIKSIFKPVVESDTIKEVKQDLTEVKQEVADTIKKTSVQTIKDFKGNVIWEAPERKKMATWKKILIWIVIIKIITLIFA